MLVYAAPSALACAYLLDDPGYLRTRGLLQNPERLLVTATSTIVEVTALLVRASRADRLLELDSALAVLASDLGEDGPVTLVAAPRDTVERRAAQIVYAHGLRALDAIHLATAELAAVPLLEGPGDKLGFASRDTAQSEAAAALGFIPV
ncbi:type II toxin-antitoxin system VapC family toxin [Planomonospora algeriensis]